DTDAPGSRRFIRTIDDALDVDRVVEVDSRRSSAEDRIDEVVGCPNDRGRLPPAHVVGNVVEGGSAEVHLAAIDDRGRVEKLLDDERSLASVHLNALRPRILGNKAVL